ncbi:peptidase S8 and S53, subtilisin, kexin, sedolisin [Richelia sinica FACHB-800]|uniref:Peptidase S8 and S53, subtilisin, kexin, sedolisin n=1 Tax=Richelia sinica FACHB-800 TaxID=1357546 RepID=A0A975T8N6_9NOST|nr:S8 family serine peptidase [Richelia sinica]MBD2666728.1 S8 family serine peptidase [Richelia sinica FACHB-800]QXE24276.1 peptidase S8 and S53, subtilisin, kexin, sedolisin [Richelia sinica FACHB-800]
MSKKLIWLSGLTVSLMTVPVVAAVKLGTSLGSNGIDALKLQQAPYNLTGRKIAIGQVEIGRPGMFGWDKAVSKNSALSPVAVFLRNSPAKSNSGVDTHAYNVAAVMVSKDKALPGVAPEARLYSSAVGSTKNMGQPEECLSAQHIALQNGGDIRAINFSFGEPLSRDPRSDAVLDGNALLTLCIDWSSRFHDVVYAIAGNQGRGGIPIPTDNFNGVNVAFSSRRDGIFRKVDVSNLAGSNQGVEGRLVGKEFNIGGRRAIGIVAPGSNIPLLAPDGKVNKGTGTSFATPHLTATVALLQEFADRQLHSKQSRWTTDARNHQVMKAVLLNSADKIKDGGDGLRLGMTRIVIDKQNRDWLNSDAYHDPKIPLDAQMGSGHLNAFRAYTQFSAGQWRPAEAVSAIGWDYGTVNAGESVEYALAHPLKQNSFVALTLSWDRLVELEDKNKNQQYDVGENFRDRGVNNLDLYLVPANTQSSDSGQLCSSISDIDNIEHIFCPVPKTGNYKIRVQFRQQVNTPTQPYALAWWTVPEN